MDYSCYGSDNQNRPKNPTASLLEDSPLIPFTHQAIDSERYIDRESLFLTIKNKEWSCRVAL